MGKVPKIVISAGAEIMSCEQIDKQSVAWEPLIIFLHISILKFELYIQNSELFQWTKHLDPSKTQRGDLNIQ